MMSACAGNERGTIKNARRVALGIFSGKMILN
jgi:hypothetical protein